jgi:2,3-bisphosphoglycerate-dependent phosphoglycerate mutase
MTDWPSPSSLWLLRHAESIGNVARDKAEYGGLEVIELAERDMDVPLSERGVEQANEFGTWLVRQDASSWPDVVLSSPYLRAEQSARAILAADKRLSDIRLIIDERLRERELGILDLLTGHGIQVRQPAEAERRRKLGKFYHRPPGGESWVDVVLRLRSFWADCCRLHEGKLVLVVTHEVVILLFRYLLEVLTEAEVLELNRAVQLSNCGLTVFDFSGAEPKLTMFDDTRGLRAAPVTEESDVAAGSR